jgi:DNA-binding transcriptional regulator YdaS (Cro superfamily)
MDLRSYLDSLPRGGVAEFAKKLGIERVYLSQLASTPDRQPSPQLCVSIEQATGGQVTRIELRNDWKAIWPELERRKQARA